MLISAMLAALQAEAASAAADLTVTILFLGVIIFLIAAMWKVYEKANEPGWAVLIPIYAQIVQARIGGKSPWWVLAMFIPGLNLIAFFVLGFGLAERFRKSSLFGLGLVLLPFIFYPMLAFGDAEASPRYA